MAQRLMISFFLDGISLLSVYNFLLCSLTFPHPQSPLRLLEKLPHLIFVYVCFSYKCTHIYMGFEESGQTSAMVLEQGSGCHPCVQMSLNK